MGDSCQLGLQPSCYKLTPPPTSDARRPLSTHPLATQPLPARYWNDPAVLQKLGGAMGDVFDFEALTGAEGEEGEEAEEEEPTVHSAASDGAQRRLPCTVSRLAAAGS